MDDKLTGAIEASTYERLNRVREQLETKREILDPQVLTQVVNNLAMAQLSDQHAQSSQLAPVLERKGPTCELVIQALVKQLDDPELSISNNNIIDQVSDLIITIQDSTKQIAYIKLLDQSFRIRRLSDIKTYLNEIELEIQVQRGYRAQQLRLAQEKELAQPALQRRLESWYPESEVRILTYNYETGQASVIVNHQDYDISLSLSKANTKRIRITSCNYQYKKNVRLKTNLWRPNA